MKKLIPHIITLTAFVIFIVLGLACASAPDGGSATGYTARQQQQLPAQQQQSQQQQGSQTPAQQGQSGQVPTQQQAPAYWTGNGGRGMRLGILLPQSRGLSENQEYLPAMVQGVLVSNISRYSAISVLDRVSLDRVIEETLDPTYEDDWNIVSLGHVAQVGHMMTGSIIRTSTGFSLQINVTDTTAQANTIASYSGTCTAPELDDHSAINRATLELLSQMNVQLNARARNELARASAQESVIAQTALARGVTAERNGYEVAALSYFLQATEIDPSLAEAETRLNSISASFTNEGMGADVRNDIQRRNQWMDRLRETEEFLAQYLRESPAFYLVYPSSNDQLEIEYERNTVTLGIEFSSLPEPLWFESINRLTQTIRDSLLATGRAEAWRLNWPAQTVTMPSPFANANNTYNVAVEILNAGGRVIGRQTVNLRFGWFIHEGFEQTGHIVPYLQFGTKVSFPGINVSDITDNLGIRVSSINNTPASSASQLGIRILPDNEYNNIQSIVENGLQIDNLRQYDIRFDRNRNLLRGYSGSSVTIAIPYGVTLIDGSSGLREKGLTSVIIPSSVITIGQYAFMDNRLTSVIIPDSVTSISFQTFRNNSLTSVFIGNNVTLIGHLAFEGNDISNFRNISIGANVQFDGNPFDYRFNDFYKNTNRRAGTYTYDGSKWNYSGNR